MKSYKQIKLHRLYEMHYLE